MSEASCIRLFQQPNMGVTKARNAGLRRLLPQTGFVSFLDSDDISPAGRFKDDLALFETDPGLDLTYSLMTLADNLDDETLEPAYRALALSLPSEADIARDIGKGIDPDAIFAAREALALAIAKPNRDSFSDLYERLADKGPFSPNASSAGRRAMRNILLDYLALLPEGAALAASHFRSASNMTD
ncbi:MAG: DUF3458 domain-containing protein, partial [Mesorhizobium sp.]